MSTEETKTPAFAAPPDEEVVEARMREGVFFLGAFVLVVLVGLITAMVTWIFHPEPPAPCISNCPPPKVDTSSHGGPALTEAKSFKSSLGFTVEYPSSWSIRDSNSSAVLFATRAGLLWFEGGKTTASAPELIRGALGRFNKQVIPDLTEEGPLRGAHVGSQEGTGTFFKGTYVPPSGGGNSLLIRIGVIVAKRKGLTILVTALLPYDANNDQIVGGGEVDYALTEFRWPGE
jgi:hypothetical protein